MSPTATVHPAAHDTTIYSRRFTLQMARPTRGSSPKRGQARPLTHVSVRKGSMFTSRLFAFKDNVVNVTVTMMTAVEYGSGFAMTTLRTAHANTRPTSCSREQSDSWNSGVVDHSVAATLVCSPTMTMAPLIMLKVRSVAQAAFDSNPTTTIIGRFAVVG